MELIESELKFTFNDSWTNIIKFDESESFDKIKQITGTKAVDFVGIKNNSLYFIEVKNERNNKQITIADLLNKLTEIEKKITHCKTINNNEEMLIKNINEIGQKVKDSLALIIGVNCISQSSKYFLDYKQILCCDKPNIKIILWNENNWINLPKKDKLSNDILNKQLKKKLLWFTKYIFINTTTRHNTETFGFTVEPIV